MALIAPFARVARSTPYHGDHRMPATERYCRPADQRVPRARWQRPPEESPTLLTAEPLDLDYQHEIFRRLHQERDQASAVRAEMQ
jgi:hypothetical protein